MKEIVIATHNQHKLSEFRRMLSPHFDKIYPASDFCTEDIEETGSSYQENAAIKAYALYNLAAPNFVLGDDSGIQVSVLNNGPGLYSARYAPTQEERIDKMLREMAGQGNRQAKQVCTIAVCFRHCGPMVHFSHEVQGVIATEPRGSGGFGYDSIFLVPELGQTFAELGEEEKDRISHRGVAVAKFLEWLKEKNFAPF